MAPVWSKMGAPMQWMPSSCSSASRAKPCSRIRSSSAWSPARVVRVLGVKASSRTPYRAASRSSLLA